MTAGHDGPFASAAQELAEAGLAVIPCGGEKGKTPQIEFKANRYRLSTESIERMAQRFGNANVGVLTGKLSRVVVVDVDDPGAVDPMIERFGDTPLVAGTPSGGVHLYYRYAGERCSNLRRREGLKVDIKGAGGLVIAPSSVNPITGKPYLWLRGSPADIRALPGVRPGSVAERHDVEKFQSPGTIKKGLRNDTAFLDLLREARCCDSLDALQDVAETINGTFEPPMSDTELAGVVGKVWKYETTGNNWNGGEPMIAFTDSHMAILEAYPYGMALRVHLERKHGARLDPFAIVAPAMAEAHCIPGWGWKSYRTATTWLVKTDFLRVIHKGGKGPGDAWLYKLSTPKK